MGRFYRERSASVWFYDWIKSKVGEQLIEQTLHARYGDVEEIYQNERPRFLVVPSDSMEPIMHRASEFALRTVGRKEYDLRHLLAAMLLADRSAAELSGNNEKLFAEIYNPEFREILLSNLKEGHEPREDIEEWARILSVSRYDANVATPAAEITLAPTPTQKERFPP
ncbi:MAG TPA: hypothetical protein VMU22_07350, partial [Rhizomicrobium sp.]|nr:hypothetical protein [Rhizomicrobium sp.]